MGQIFAIIYKLLCIYLGPGGRDKRKTPPLVTVDALAKHIRMFYVLCFLVTTDSGIPDLN